MFLSDWCCSYSIFRNYAFWALFVSSEGFHGASQVVEQCQVVVLLGASTGCSCASGRRSAFWLQQERSNCAAEFRAKGPCAHSHNFAHISAKSSWVALQSMCSCCSCSVCLINLINLMHHLEYLPTRRPPCWSAMFLSKDVQASSSWLAGTVPLMASNGLIWTSICR